VTPKETAAENSKSQISNSKQIPKSKIQN